MKKIIIFLFTLVFIYSFTPQDAPNTFTDSRDGKVYKTVTIGEQVWMAENLAYLPSVSPPARESRSSPYYYVYDYNGTELYQAKSTASFSTYGVLYNWPAALTACPEGLHLPSDAEWIELENYLIEHGYNYDGTTTDNKIAKSMSSAIGWKFDDTREGVPGNNDYPEYINKSGFSALPGGDRTNAVSDFDMVGYQGSWWCSTEFSIYYAVSWWLFFSQSNLIRLDYEYKECGNSIRCIKD